MSGYVVTWTIYIESEEGREGAAREVAERYFQTRIAEGEPDTACTFVVTDMAGRSRQIDLAEQTDAQ